MKVKSKLAIVALFSCCAIMSMGFATWTIGQNSTSIQGTISADKVVMSNDYIYTKENIANYVPKGLDYTAKGFREAAESTPYKANLTVTYFLNIAKSKDLYGDAATVTVEITLGYNSALKTNNIFADDSYIDALVTAGNITNVTPKSVVEEYKYKLFLTFSLSNAAPGASEASFALTYTFDLVDQDTFTNYIYKPLSDVNLRFEFNATLKGA